MDRCKKCSVCGVVAPLTSFHRRAAKGDGRRAACKSCSSKAGASKLRDAETVKRSRVACKAYAAKERDALNAQYGGKCACCGIETREFLSIDHINGRPAEHSRSRGNMSGRRLVAFLKRNGYPRDNYQLLCYNCNCAKGILGECPHSNSRHLPAVLLAAN